MAVFLSRLLDLFRRREDESEYQEQVEHDIVIIDGLEVTSDDPEEGQ